VKYVLLGMNKKNKGNDKNMTLIMLSVADTKPKSLYGDSFENKPKLAY